MPDKNTEQLLREQADAVLKVQEEAINTQMKMMESLYGNNPEMLAMMKAQMQQAMANQKDLIAQAQTAAFQAVDAAQNGGQFDPQALIQTLQNNAQSMGVDLNAGSDESREEGYDNAMNYIEQLRTDFTESEPRPAARGSKEARIFGYLLGGIVGNLNGHELDQLDPEEHEPFFEEKVRTILSEYWGITNTDELGETLGDLLEAAVCLRSMPSTQMPRPLKKSHKSSIWKTLPAPCSVGFLLATSKTRFHPNRCAVGTSDVLPLSFDGDILLDSSTKVQQNQFWKPVLKKHVNDSPDGVNSASRIFLAGCSGAWPPGKMQQQNGWMMPSAHVLNS